MDCTLMHKRVPVVDLVMDPDSGHIDKTGATHDPEHLPVGTAGLSGAEKGEPNRAFLNEWLTSRSIPASRANLESALCQLNLRTPAALIAKCYGLSLSDHYWLCPKGSGLEWDAINFFENDFSKDIGEMLFGGNPANPSTIDMISPDNTSDGWLMKKWVIKNGKRVLMKGGSGVFMQEPFNEVIATAIMRRLGIPHIPYALTGRDEKPFCLCENFVDTKIELIPAWRIIQTAKRDNNDSALTHLLRCCDRLGIPDVKPAIDKMLVLDYIIANEDRHYNNFGFLRDAETLKWLGLAPIYDSGTSLWHNTQNVGSQVESKPFRKTHDEQIKLVERFGWYDFGALDDLADECAGVLSRSPDINGERRAAITKAVMERAGQVEWIAQQNR